MMTPQQALHSLGVAQMCARIAKRLGRDETFQREMFILGWLHDIGYEYGTDNNHGEAGARMLMPHRYLYLNEVRYHGIEMGHFRRRYGAGPYRSLVLDILNAADLQTAADGRPCTVQERLAEALAEGSGPGSARYDNILNVARELGMLDGVNALCENPKPTNVNP